ncbi:hypothetical protein GW17_00050085 [Ensete ventricosum]|nr:hypothetical protein GW17_00050085 [Ensete ventricosum]
MGHPSVGSRATCRRQPPLPTGDSPYGGHRCPRAITGHLYKWPDYGCPQVVPPSSLPSLRNAARTRRTVLRDSISSHAD